MNTRISVATALFVVLLALVGMILTIIKGWGGGIFFTLVVIILLGIAYIDERMRTDELLAALRSTFEEESRYHTKYIKLLEHYRKMFRAIQEEHPNIDETHPQYNTLAKEMLADVVDDLEEENT